MTINSSTKILILGASGLIGNALITNLTQKGHQVIAVSRSYKNKSEKTDIQWIDLSLESLVKSLNQGVDIVINLAGETITQAWTKENWNKFEVSRIDLTQMLVTAIEKTPVEMRPKQLINASAIGYYGDTGQKITTESAKPAVNNPLAQLCVDWEQAAFKAESSGVKVAVMRIGLVLGKEARAWKMLKQVFKIGIGGRLGDGKQIMAWIHLDDVIGAILHIINNELSGAYNFVSPQPVSNQKFTEILAASVNRWVFLPVPAFALKLKYQGFEEVLLKSQNIAPQALLDSGYEFKHTDLKIAFESLLD